MNKLVCFNIFLKIIDPWHLNFFRRAYKRDTWNLKLERPVLDQSWLGSCGRELRWKHWFVLLLHFYSILIIIGINRKNCPGFLIQSGGCAWPLEFLNLVLFHKLLGCHCTSTLIIILWKKVWNLGLFCSCAYLLDKNVNIYMWWYLYTKHFMGINFEGYGREYRERLLNKWGIVDVNDCCSCGKFLVMLILL